MLINKVGHPGSPSDVNPDLPTIDKDQDVLYLQGTWVYDPLHEGYNEIHPIKVCTKIGCWRETGPIPTANQTEGPPDTISHARGTLLPIILRLRQGFQEAQAEATLANQWRPEHQWRFHPLIDACASDVILTRRGRPWTTTGRCCGTWVYDWRDLPIGARRDVWNRRSCRPLQFRPLTSFALAGTVYLGIPYQLQKDVMNLRTVSIATSLSVCAAAAFFVLTGEAQSPVDQPQFEPNQVLVQFRGQASPAARAAARGRVKGYVRKSLLLQPAGTTEKEI